MVVVVVVVICILWLGVALSQGGYLPSDEALLARTRTESGEDCRVGAAEEYV